MKYDINLLSKKELHFVDRVVHFSLNYLRYILVVTQIIVIVVLFYRFKIDNDILDLRESIAQKQEIVRVTQPLLDEAAKLDVQVDKTLTSVDTQNTINEAITYFLSVFPQDITLEKLSIQNDEFSFTGTSLDAQTIQFFYRRLRADKKFTGVTLGNITKNEEGGFSFTMVLNKFAKNQI